MKFYRDVVTFHYENGMRLHVLPQPGTAVEVECFIRTGSIHEGRHLGCGLSHFLEHMMFQGCRDYPGTAVSDTIDRLGGTMNAYTSYDHTAYHATVAAKHLGTAVKVLGSMVRYPEFPEARFRAEREVILRERELGVDNPSRRLFEALNQELFKIHPMRHPIIGYRELIAGVSKEMMETYYRERYTPGRCFWIIVGDVVPEQAYEEIGALLGDWPAAHLAEALLPEEPVQCAPRSSSFRFADPLARLATAVRIPEASHPDIPALDVLAGIFGMGDGSRLVRVLELEQKLAIDLRSFCYTQPCGGLLGIGCTAAPGKLNKLQSALKRELEKIRKGDLNKAEVEREKMQQTADHLRQLRGLREIAADIAGGVIAHDAPALSDLYMEKLAKLDVDDIRRVAATYLDENSFATVTQLTGKESARIHSAPAPKPPRPETSRLGNGARVLTLTDRRLPMIDLALLLPAGTIFEAPAQGGLSGLVADLITAGTKFHNETEILRRLDGCGADLSVNSGLNSWVLELNAPRAKFKKALEILAEILHAPAFGPEEFERERYNRLELLRSRAQSPRAAAQDLARRLLFGSHPYGWGVNGTEQQLAALTPEQAREFYRTRWTPSRVVFGFGGDCSAEETREFAELLAGGIDWNQPEIELPPEPVFQHGFRSGALPIEREQTAVIRALPGISGCDRRYPAFEILNQATNGLASQLFRSIREDNALAYTTGMQMSGGFHRGSLMFHVITTAEQAEVADRLIAAEIDRLATEGLRGEEFLAAREGAAFAAARLTESVGSALTASVLSLHYGRPAEESWLHEAELRACPRDSVNETIRDFMDNTAAVRVFAGRDVPTA